MVPKKTKELVKLTASQTGEDEEFIGDLVSFYWKEIRKSLVEMKAHNVFVEGLGTFQAKHWKIDEILIEYKRYLEFGDFTTFRRFPIKKSLETNIEKLTRLRSYITEEEQRKQQVKFKRDEKDKNNLEE